MAATTDGTHYLYSIVVQNSKGEDKAFSYFTATASSIKNIFPTAERFYNLCVL